MGVLIDSSVLIHFERSGTDVSTYVRDHEDEETFLSIQAEARAGRFVPRTEKKEEKSHGASA